MLPPELKQTFTFDDSTVTYGLMGSFLGSLLIALLILMQEVVAAIRDARERAKGFVKQELWDEMQAGLAKAKVKKTEPAQAILVGSAADKFMARPQYMSFDDATSFVGGLAGLLGRFGCSGAPLDPGEEFEENDGGQWLKELMYVWAEPARETYPPGARRAPRLQLIRSWRTRATTTTAGCRSTICAKGEFGER